MTSKKSKTPKMPEIAAAALPERTREQSRAILRKLVRNFYDLQRLRLQTAGRTYKKTGKAPPIELHELDKALLEQRAKELEKAEKVALGDVATHLKTIGFYKAVLSDKKRYKGIGPTMAGVILAEFDIYREDTPSKMWSFCGLAPIPAKRCCKCHTVLGAKEEGELFHPATARRRKVAPGEPSEIKIKCVHAGKVLSQGEFYDSGKAMRPAKGEKLPYNAFLKTKLVGVLGSVLIKVGSPWRKFYDDYKHRKQSAGWGISDGHRHNAATRYMVKMLLLDIWKEWRAFEGLPVRPSYQEEKLGHSHAAHDTQKYDASQFRSAPQNRNARQSADDNRNSDASQDDFDEALVAAEIALLDDE